MEWEIIDYSLNASKDIDMGIIDPVLTCGSEPKMDAMHSTLVGSACAGLVFDAGCHEVRSSDVSSVCDTRKSL